MRAAAREQTCVGGYSAPRWFYARECAVCGWRGTATVLVGAEPCGEVSAVRSAPCNLFIASSFQTIRGLGLGGRGPLTAGGGLDPARPGVGGGGVNLDIFGRGEQRATQALNGSWARRPSGTARSFHEILGQGLAARGALANGGLPGASSPGFAAPRCDFRIFGRGGGGGPSQVVRPLPLWNREVFPRNAWPGSCRAGGTS